ncbi:MAG TPA: oligosaccharide flippase family protein [Pyrinomonadaceae bacterium]|nr:oligosaccharide flippase family protein [Pyrinomonadaceae bacterium]
MTRTRRAILGIVTNYAATILLAVSSFVIIPIILRYLSREDYGLWATIGQMLGYLALLDLGVGSAVVRRTARMREHGDIEAVNRMVSTAVALYCLLGLVFLLAGLGIGFFLPNWSAIPQSRAHVAVIMFIIMIVYGAISFPLRVASSTLTGYQHMAAANMTNMAANLLAPVVSVVLLLAGLGILSLPLGQVAAGLLAAIAAFVILKRAVPNLRINWASVSRAEAREIFGWSWQLFLNNIAVAIIYQTDNLVVAGSVGLAAVTVYTLTSRLPMYAMPLVFALGDSCHPGAFELYEQGNFDRLREVYTRVMRLTVAAGMAIAVVAVAFNESFMRLWVGESNYGGLMLTVIFAFILCYRVMMQVSSVIVISSGKLKGVVAMSIMEAALNLVLSLWWVRYYGIIGVALGTAVAGVLTSGWYVVGFVSRELRMNVFEYLGRGVIPPLVCALPAAGTAYLLTHFYPATTWPRLFLEAGTVGLVYALCYLFIGLTTGERDFLTARLAGFYEAVGGRRRRVATLEKG